MMTKPMQRPGMGMGASGPMMSEEELYADEPEAAAESFTISKAALPRAFPVGSHLVIVEDLGEELRLEPMKDGPPEPAETSPAEGLYES